MAKTFTLDAARIALAKAEAARNTSIIPVCTAGQMIGIEQRIKSALAQDVETRKDHMQEQGSSRS
jgi:hypothetical protein